MRIYLILSAFILLIFFSLSCSNESETPIGPQIDQNYTWDGNYEVVKKNWVSDFDGVQSAEGLYPSALTPDASQDTIITVDTTNEINESGNTNTFEVCKYKVYENPAGGDPWCRF